MTIERIGFTSIKVKWEQMGNYTNYKISRYKIKMRFNYSPEKEYIPDLSSYSTCNESFKFF